MLLPALLAGCSSDNFTNPAVDSNNGEEQGEPILFCSGLNQTKSVIEGTYLPTDAEIGIYGLIAENTSTYSGTWSDYTKQNYLDNGKYTALAAANDTQQLKAEHVAKFPSNGKSLLFFAYYPYSAELTDASIPVSIDAAINNTTDYLYTGEGTSTAATALQRNAVSLQFKHAMARMDIKIKKGNDENLPETAVLKKIEVIFDGGMSGTMSITDGSITSASEPTQGTVIADNLNVIVDDATKTVPVDTNCKFLLFPSNDVKQIKLTMTRSDAEAQGGIEYSIIANTSEIKLEAGKITTLTLTYIPNDALFNSKVTDWVSGENKDFDAH